MISHGKDIKIFSGNSNPELAKSIANILGVEVGKYTHVADSLHIYEEDFRFLSDDTLIAQEMRKQERINNKLLKNIYEKKKLRLLASEKYKSILETYNKIKNDKW